MKKLYRLSLYQMMRGIGVAVAAIMISGCASIPAPTEQMAVSKAAINNAVNAGSNEFASQPLKFALDKMTAADQAMAEKKISVRPATGGASTGRRSASRNSGAFSPGKEVGARAARK